MTLAILNSSERLVVWGQDAGVWDWREGHAPSGRVYRRGRPIPMHPDPLGLDKLLPELEDSDIVSDELERVGDVWTIYLDSLPHRDRQAYFADAAAVTPLFQTDRMDECYLAADGIEALHLLVSRQSTGGHRLKDVDISVEALIRARLAAILERREALDAVREWGFTPAMRRDPAAIELFDRIEALSAALGEIEARLEAKSVQIPL